MSAAGAIARQPTRAVVRVERRKLAAQLPVRILALAFLAGPFAFALLVRAQSASLEDPLYGTWVRSSGFAFSLLLLSFAATWAFPVLAGVIAADVFAGEDRHGTWKTVLTRSCSLRDVFAGKVLSAMAATLAFTALLAWSSTLAGLLVFGEGRLVDLAGHELSAGHLFAIVAGSWVVALPAVMAYTGVGIVCSVAGRNPVLGVLGPLALTILCQLLGIVGDGVVVHQALIASAFDGWHGLAGAPGAAGRLVVALAVSAAWLAGTIAVSWRLLSRREFSAGAGWRRPSWRAALVAVGGTAAVVGILALATGWGPAGVDARGLKASLAPAFGRLTTLQQRLLGHPIPAGARYRIRPVCTRPGTTPVGYGDWSCTMHVYILLPGSTRPLTDTRVDYDVSVATNGCYRAQAPPLVVGGARIREPGGGTAVNPLATIYGCVDVL